MKVSSLESINEEIVNLEQKGLTTDRSLRGDDDFLRTSNCSYRQEIDFPELKSVRNAS